MPKFIDLTGQQFDKLTVVKRVKNSDYGAAMWLCDCGCGNQKIIQGSSLISGSTRSCGCIMKRGNNLKHGYSHLRSYNIWQNMNNRCNDSTRKDYKYYGKRKIKVCYRWSNKNPKGFENFYTDIGEIPFGLTLDRTNNGGDYSPENCRLTTMKTQNRNSRHNKLETFNNKTQCRSAWAEERNFSRNIIRDRLDKLGWSIEKTLITPVRKHKKYKKRIYE